MMSWITGPVSRRWVWRPMAWTGLVAGLPVLVGVVNGKVKLESVTAQPEMMLSGSAPVRPAHDPSKPTAVVVLGDGLTEATDFLAPYEILARSGAYNVYAVARVRRPARLFPGEIAVLPHLSIAEYDAQIGRSPNVIVVPFMEREEATEDPELAAWIRRHWQRETTLLSICGGAYNLARAGITAGRKATSHQSILRLVRRTDRHAVEWLDGVRYVDDGNYVSSAGVSSGIDATLHLLRREHGAEMAERIAAEIAYPHTRYLDDPRFTVPTASPARAYLDGMYHGFEDLGLVLYDGASEIQLAALSDSWPRSLNARLRTIVPDHGTVRTRHGLDLVPRWSFADVPKLDRVLIAGNPRGDGATALATWAVQQGAEPETMSAHGFPYDAALVDMAKQTSTAAAIDAARGIEYPIDHLGLEAGLPVRTVARPLAIAMLGLVLGMLTLGHRRPLAGC